MKYDINRPWLSLDDWQKEYINTDPNKDCFLLCGRQVGKTTAMSIKAVELCVNHFKKGEYVLIASITEKQAYHMLTKALTYAEEKYYRHIKTGKDRPTMHKILFKNGTGILCYAAGETGEGLRGFTIKKQMIDEGSRMSEEFYIAIMPQLSVVNGSMDIASTPYGKLHPDGKPKFFYKCSNNPLFKKFYVSAEDCPRHSKDFLEQQRASMSELGYAQEYLAIFTDELKRLFSDELIERACVLYKEPISYNSIYFLGVDIAGMGKDETTYEVVQLIDDKIYHRDNIIEKYNYTFNTFNKIIELDKQYKEFNKIGVDDAGVGFGVFSELLNNDDTKRRTVALNNASRPLDYSGKRSHRILKEEMYFNLLTLLENRRLRLLNSEEVKQSLASIQLDEGKIFGSYSHITEGLIRAVWLASKAKGLNIWFRSISI